jgi:hypothetical protein
VIPPLRPNDASPFGGFLFVLKKVVASIIKPDIIDTHKQQRDAAMSIVNFTHDRAATGFMPHYEWQNLPPQTWPEGAYCPIGSYDNQPEEIERVGALVLWETHKGLCLYEWESNGRDDSDFYMMLWNPETKKPEPYQFASTRGWTYPAMGSRPDATPEVIAEWEAYKKAAQEAQERATRHAKAQTLVDMRRHQSELAQRHGFNVIQFRKWAKREYPERVRAALHLLQSTRLRSEFKIKLRDQIVKWMKESQHKYPSPLSYKQWECIE